jgi:sugar diacid utilization regulator
VIEVDDRAMRALAKRISVGKEGLAERAVERYREEIVGYQSEDNSERADALEFALRSIEALLTSLERGEPVTEEYLKTAREVAARRADQGVSFDAVQRQGRLWGETFWEAVLAAARPDRPEEREAALQIAGRLLRNMDVVSTAMGYAYLDEVNDRGLLGRELLDALLAGHGDDERVRRLARMLHRQLGQNHVVVVVRGDGLPGENGAKPPRAGRILLDRMVDAARTYLRPSAGSVLVGIREGDVVALYPSAKPEGLDTVRRECAALAAALAVDVSVGMSGWHAGRSAIATAYGEAREAMEIAAGTGIRGRAVVLDDVLVDDMLLASPHARGNLKEVLRPLVEYDRAHHAELIPTLRAYLSAGANLAETGRLLTVHPNTVGYRLRRIKELSGRDPHAMEDLQVLFLALKLTELSAREPDDA